LKGKQSERHVDLVSQCAIGFGGLFQPECRIDGQRREYDSLIAQAGAAMAPTQAIQFAAKFPTVLSQFNDPVIQGGLETSLSATIFKNTEDNQAGSLTLAFRGVLGEADYSTAGDIYVKGAAYHQIVGMANWWRQIASPAGELVAQYRLALYPENSVPEGALILRLDGLLVLVLESAGSVEATGALTAALGADPDGRIDVTGHSLGGHLAMAFSTLFSGQTGQVTAFNAQ
jgi:hypothetical protein